MPPSPEPSQTYTVQPAPLTAPLPEAKYAVQRLASVDALRGFDMFWIIGGQKVVLTFAALIFGTAPAWLTHQLEHVEWEGFTFWDLIMPLFLFVSGVSLPFSLAKWSGSDESSARLYLRLVRRLLLLWVLGMAVQGRLFRWDLDELRLYSNTLQAIAAGYLIAFVLMRWCSIRGQLVGIGALLIGFWAALEFVPIPGQGAGHLEPLKNLALYVDEVLLRGFRDGTTYTWILSSLGFGATVLMGAMAGHVLRAERSEQQKFLTLLAAGVGCLAAGWMWGLFHPIIKHIWTSSMNLWACGWSFLLLAGFYWVIDIRGYRKWAFPLVVIGMNAIAVYVATHLFDFDAMADVFVGSLKERWGAFGQFLSAFGALLIPWLILLYLYRKKTFIRL